MNEKDKKKDDLLFILREREKELNCIYRIEEILSKPEAELDEICKNIVKVIPPGWQYPDVCVVRITLYGSTYESENFEQTPWVLGEDIVVQDRVIGNISVYYTEEMPKADEGPFLKQERKLLKTIVERLSHFLMLRKMRYVFREYETARKDIEDHKEEEWRVVLNLIRQTDRDLFLNVSRRMLNHLSWSGVEDAKKLMELYHFNLGDSGEWGLVGENRPYQKSVLKMSEELSDEIFKIAEKHLKDEQILLLIRKWIQEDKLSFLARVVDQRLPLSEVIDAVRRYHHILPEGVKLPKNVARGVCVSLIRRLISDQIEYINKAKNFVDISDFHELLSHIVFHPDSIGKVGGKSAGLFLAMQIIKNECKSKGKLCDIKVPRTWYLLSDGLMHFLNYNNLTEVIEQKYKDINQVILEYPHIIQTFKNSQFPPEILQGLSMVLDEVGDKPLIVRSSSLLEDRVGSAFAGKYRSVFLANQGSKEERLLDLTDGIAEVYASTFGPDPIEYRAERGLLDVYEEMGIMIQEVVGTKVGHYFFPTFAGVAFSRNEFRWSPRIKQEDGILRLVVGLGTRAVNRLSNDYPIMIAPGQPGLRVNVTVEEIIRYSPKMMDVINLKKNTFETKNIDELVREVGHDIPGMEKLVSIFDGHSIRKPMGKNIDYERDDIVVTFDGLIQDTDFVRRMKFILELLEEKLGFPVDVEFASDGNDLYLLQCRFQSSSRGCEPAPIPKDVSRDKILFSANRYISNGIVPDISHIVYVDPEGYDNISDHSTLLNVGRAVGKLNKLLPKRKFILMGPGRWGSLGDIKLGVRVTYADINNTAVLVEIARKKGNYVPDLSFGTHFFQDLVEAGIRYLPLYPDEDNTIFNERFFKNAENILPEILPDFTELSGVVKVIDVPKSTNGKVLRVLMNADLDEAVGILSEPLSGVEVARPVSHYRTQEEDNHWAWRLKMAEHIALQLDPKRFGVAGIYVFGSTKNATAGPQSDIDILIHFRGSDSQREELMLWLEGWSLCLDEMNYLRTGYRTGGLLDVHIVTDEDIKNKTSYAAKIDAVTDAARPLPMKGED
ncbi:MAG: pyruvate, phosphate dikinase [Candidatus Coatesbacteria bacterium]|nr:MAG: pyruvate, phosphate dikinase [Candidatus Coatesbacteria bacterium]